MKTLLIILSVFYFGAKNLIAQNVLKFNKQYIDCIDKWVVVNIKSDSSFMYGFLYLDYQAGLTFDYSGDFKIDKSGTFYPTFSILDSLQTTFKKRLEPNKNNISLLPIEKLSELGLKEFPDWFTIYRSDTSKTIHNYKIGQLLNIWNEPGKALIYLEKAYKMNPEDNNILYELSYSNNALKQYNTAIALLRKLLENNPNNCDAIKEISYSEVKLGNIENAAKYYQRSIDNCKQDYKIGEIAYNIAYAFYVQKNKEKFIYWVEESKKWLKTDSPYIRNLDYMESHIDDK